jgi:lysophospholipase L1-like esterase
MRRYEFSVRWPGFVQGILGDQCRIHENALNGRTTVFDDPIEEGRCGKIGFPVVLESNAPLDLVVIMLGTNDCKKRFGVDAWDIAWGMNLLVQYVKRANCGRDGGCPRILVVSPPAMGDDWDATVHGTVFGPTAGEKAIKLSAAYEEVAKLNNVDFFDAALYARGEGDCIHLSPETHRRLGEAMATRIADILDLKIP